MKKVVLLSICLGSLFTSCTLITPTEDYNIMNDELQARSGERTGEQAYLALRDRGILYFNYGNYWGEKYWMWLDLRTDASGKQVMMAHVIGHGSKRVKFVRKAVDVIYHSDPKNNNLFIIDFGKVLDERYSDFLTRYMFVEKTGNTSFRGKMITHIEWNVTTDFQILRLDSFPTDQIEESSAYDDVATRGFRYILEEPLQDGVLPAYDALKANKIIGFNYLTENGVSYGMWLDLRIGVENIMNMVFHKPGVFGTKFLAERSVFDLFYNPENNKQMIIDLGKENGRIKRYIYIEQTGGNRFRGKMIDSIQWNVSTDFQILQSFRYEFHERSYDYNDVHTSGAINGAHPDQVGKDPKDYSEALLEAIDQIGPVKGKRVFTEFTEKEPNTLTKSYTQEFWYELRDNNFDSIYFTSIVEYNGEDKKGQFFKNYFGERKAVQLLDLEKQNLTEFMVSYKNKNVHGSVFANQGYELYRADLHFATGVVNTKLGSDNVWRTIDLEGHLVFDPNHTMFLVKKQNNGSFIFVDVFQSSYHAFTGLGQTYLIEDEDFDIDSVSSKFIYHLR